MSWRASAKPKASKTQHKPQNKAAGRAIVLPLKQSKPLQETALTEQRGSSRGQGPLLALPQSHSRAYFVTARQWRGCGNSALPVSATGSGKALFSNPIARRSKSLENQGFSKTAFCVRPKCSAGKRSQKSPTRDFFDKLTGSKKARHEACLFCCLSVIYSARSSREMSRTAWAGAALKSSHTGSALRSPA